MVCEKTLSFILFVVQLTTNRKRETNYDQKWTKLKQNQVKSIEKVRVKGKLKEKLRSSTSFFANWQREVS